MRSAFVVLAAVAGLLAGCNDAGTGLNPEATLVLGDTAIAFVVAPGASAPAPQTVPITAGGGATLDGLAVGTIQYSGPGGWLSASLDRPVAPATLTLAVTPGSLPAATYSASVPISSPGAGNAPQTVNVSLVISAAGGATTTLQAAGQAATFLDAVPFRTQLTLEPGAQYLVAVVNTSPSNGAKEDFTLVGSTSGATARIGAPPPAPGAALSPRAGFAADVRAVRNAQPLHRLAANHLAILDVNRQVYAHLLARQGQLGLPAMAARSPASFAISQSVGTVNKVYVRTGLQVSCGAVDSIGARTVAVGQHVIVLADTNRTDWPDGDRPDSAFYQQFADEYDRLTWPHIQQYIGDPLVLDAQLSGTGKVTVAITPVLNRIGGGVVAFVNPCDFFATRVSSTDTVFSNETEIFYSLAPSANAGGIDNWKKSLRSVAAHETKHIVSIGSRLKSNSPVLEQVWLEEGLAQVSSEIWMRNFNGATWKGHAGFAETVECELNFGSGSPCNPRDDKPHTLTVSHLPFLFEYLEASGAPAPSGLGSDTPSNYGAGWSMARWTIDEYATDEAGFIKGLIAEPALVGLDNLSSHTAQSVPLLLTYWNLAIAVFQTPAYTAADPRVAVPSFDFADIFQTGQTALSCNGVRCGLFTTSGQPVYPVQPVQVTSGSISKQVTGLSGTAAAYFLLSATSGGTESLQLQSGSGGPLAPSSALRVGIVRVK